MLRSLQFAVVVLTTVIPPAWVSATESVRADWVSANIVPQQIQLDPARRPIIAAWRAGDPIVDLPRRATRTAPYVAPREAPAPGDRLADQQARESVNPPSAFNVPLFDVAGMGYAGIDPPDTSGDIGTTHFIQSVNSNQGAIYRIYDRSGNAVAGPFNLEGLGTGLCANGRGDGVVMFDELASRWLLTEFVVAGNAICVYVSAQADPTVPQTWTLYQIITPDYPDYPKYGVWPGTYIVGINDGVNTRSVLALDRPRMLAGQPMVAQRFTVPVLSGFSFQLLVPADHDGHLTPLPGAKPLFARQVDDEAHRPSQNDPTRDFIELYELNVDFTTPANSVLSGPVSISTSEFDADLGGLTGLDGIIQPGGTELDSVREPIMNRFVYRVYPGIEVLAGNFATDRSGTDLAGVRWFELRRTGGVTSPWVLFQEGTLAAADNTSRWIGTNAMDRAGNWAIGYNATGISPNVFPSLRFAGRRDGQARQTMSFFDLNVEAGSAAHSGPRWADYAQMGVDPVDGCTFWLTGEYQAGANWGSRIATMRHDGCGTATFLLNSTELTRFACVTPARTLPAWPLNQSALDGHVATVAYTLSGPPTGVSGAIAPSPISGNAANALLISLAANAAPGTHILNVQANDGSQSKLLDLRLVLEASPTAISLLGPADLAVNQLPSPTLTWTAQAGISSYEIEIASDTLFQTILRSTVVQGTSYVVDPPLPYGQTVYWRVRATNSCGDGPNGTTRRFTVRADPFNCPAGTGANALFFDTMENGVNGWTHLAAVGTDQWTQTTTQSASPIHSWLGSTNSLASDQALLPPLVVVPAGQSALKLRFKHRYTLERPNATVCNDGGTLEYSANGGPFEEIGSIDLIEGGPYTALTVANNGMGARPAFCGQIDTFRTVTANLDHLIGQNVQLRFRLGGNPGTFSQGWWIDDVALRACGPDADTDGIGDLTDNCPAVANVNQLDNDADDTGDACDPDDDNDTVIDGNDNCPLLANLDQLNNDSDSLGDACDSDDDNDGRPDANDNCPFEQNPLQLDSDGDLLGNACDPDDDNDGLADGADNCPVNANPDQMDADADLRGDACDACVNDPLDTCTDGLFSNGFENPF